MPERVSEDLLRNGSEQSVQRGSNSEGDEEKLCVCACLLVCVFDSLSLCVDVSDCESVCAETGHKNRFQKNVGGIIWCHFGFPPDFNQDCII